MQLLTTVKMKWKYEDPSVMNRSNKRGVLYASPSILAHSSGSDNKKIEIFLTDKNTFQIFNFFLRN